MLLFSAGFTIKNVFNYAFGIGTGVSTIQTDPDILHAYGHFVHLLKK